MQILSIKENLQERHTRTKLRRGQGEKTTADQLELSRMSSLTTLPKANESESWEPFPCLSVKGDYQDHLVEPWLKAQSEVHFICLIDLQGKWPSKPNKRWRRWTWKSFIEAVQSLQKQRPKSKTTKGHYHLRPLWSLQKESNRDPKSHESIWNRRFLLCMQIVRVFNGPSSREEKDQHSEAALSEILQIWERTTT